MVNNDSLGIDHPLITVRDLQATARQYEALGFAPTATTYHPWGTSNRLVMFDGNFIELISVADAERIAADQQGGKYFGRYIAQFLETREGVSLVALHSRDIEADVAAIRGRGLAPSARVDFRRRVRLPDGSEGEAVVSLATYINESQLGGSHFLCQQHRPEMVFRAEWMSHRNTARRIAYCLYAADDPAALRERFEMLHGASNVALDASGRVVTVQTAGGAFVIATPEMIRHRLAAGAPPESSGDAPRIVAIGIEVADFAAALACFGAVDVAKDSRRRVATVPAHLAGNVMLQFLAPGESSLGNWLDAG